jgi:hypothetical protein
LGAAALRLIWYTVRVSENTKDTRLHRLYQVVFWTLLTISTPLAGFSWWFGSKLDQQMRVAEADAIAKHYSAQVISWTNDYFGRSIGATTRMFIASLAIFVFALLLPVFYRLLLYILHGSAAFSRPVKHHLTREG